MARTIINWVAQADREVGARHDGLTTAGRQELTKRRRENRQLKVERDILSQAAAWFARETGAGPPKGGVRIHERETLVRYASAVRSAKGVREVKMGRG